MPSIDEHEVWRISRNDLLELPEEIRIKLLEKPGAIESIEYYRQRCAGMAPDQIELASVMNPEFLGMPASSRRSDKIMRADRRARRSERQKRSILIDKTRQEFETLLAQGTHQPAFGADRAFETEGGVLFFSWQDVGTLCNLQSQLTSLEADQKSLLDIACSKKVPSAELWSRDRLWYRLISIGVDTLGLPATYTTNPVTNKRTGILISFVLWASRRVINADKDLTEAFVHYLRRRGKQAVKHAIQWKGIIAGYNMIEKILKWPEKNLRSVSALDTTISNFGIKSKVFQAPQLNFPPNRFLKALEASKTHLNFADRILIDRENWFGHSISSPTRTSPFNRLATNSFANFAKDSNPFASNKPRFLSKLNQPSFIDFCRNVSLSQ